MNLANIHYKTIVSENGGKFIGSITTVTEDIVAMMAKINKRETPSSFDAGEEKETKLPRCEREPVPFISHYQGSKGVKYKVRYNKEFGRKPYFFYDFPLHRNRLRCHTHSSDTCLIRARWIKKK